MGSGYDIRIVANVTRRHDLGIDQLDDRRRDPVRQPRAIRANGSQTVDLEYEYEANAAIKAAESPPRGNLPDPGKVGPSEHVFTPPPGGPSTLRIELFTNDSCSGSGLANQSISTSRPTFPRTTSRSPQRVRG